ncbi:CsbD family protein [Paraburkholderia hospita]|uniref:CsbD family protein n=1 Tax=Paraburkholderia hospita TaxID=169430 RepID=A0AAN1JMG8_9BURK|nr:CsbD family protein [Paraburkholderia hospita]AUT75602.1 CsbD family protein [Paraburkholderia hospita]
METTKTEGTLREVAGNMNEAVGSVTGDTVTQLEGKADELRGKAQQICADATELAREAMVSRPLAVLAGATALGFVIGALWSRNRDTDA